MILVRRWLDQGGLPHTEVATWIPAEDEDERARLLVMLPAEVEIQEGSPKDLQSPVILAALVGSPVELGTLGLERSGLYDAELQDGATFVTAAQHQAATRRQKDAEAAAAEDVERQLAAQAEAAQAPRTAALRKLADAAGLDPAEIAALTGQAI